jgi:hypothetical protein
MNANMKKCFVIMPISDHPDYSQGHFSRVYDFIIKPACLAADFEPIRADDIQVTNVIALDIIKNILNCEMAICDLSSRNPNVLYELGIRQAFNHPVTLIKDNKTSRIFDIQGIRDFEYDITLRADLVKDAIPALAELIKNTYEKKDHEVNSLVSLLGIEPAKQSKKTEISSESQLILSAISDLKERVDRVESRGQGTRRLYVVGGQPQTDPPSEYVLWTQGMPEPKLGHVLKTKDINELQPGSEIYLPIRGIGRIISIRQGNPKRFEIQFGMEKTWIELTETHLAQPVIRSDEK